MLTRHVITDEVGHHSYLCKLNPYRSLDILMGFGFPEENGCNLPVPQPSSFYKVDFVPIPGKEEADNKSPSSQSKRNLQTEVAKLLTRTTLTLTPTVYWCKYISFLNIAGVDNS